MRRAALVLSVLAAVAALWAVTQGLRRGSERRGVPVTDLQPLDALARSGSGRLWFVGEADLRSSLPPSVRRADGRAPDVSASLFVWNTGRDTARVVVRVYTSAAPPAGTVFEAAGHGLLAIDLAGRPDVPRDQPFWIAVDSDRPVFPQLRVAGHRPWDRVPDTLAMVLPQPGPLGPDDTAWIYPDGFQGGIESWGEEETITLLNPGTTEARAQLTYRFRDGRPSRVQSVVVPPERVSTVEVWRAFGEREGDEPVVTGDYAVLVSADRPLVSQQTRRARWRGESHVSGLRPLVPIRVAAADRAREWYYPGGWVRPLPVLPRDDYADHTWHLLFSHNLDEQSAHRLILRVHDAAGTVREADPVRVPPARSDLQWLHAAPWRGAQVPTDAPWAAVLQADGPIAPDVTIAEFDAWSQAMPGAMGATALVPGPLSGASEWWLGLAEHGGDDDRPADWRAAWQVFNPGDRAIDVTLHLLGLPAGPLQHRVTVGPGAVSRVTGEEIRGIPAGVPFLVRAVGSGSFVAQSWLRVSTRGVPGTRALVSAVGLPWRSPLPN